MTVKQGIVISSSPAMIIHGIVTPHSELIMINSN